MQPRRGQCMTQESNSQREEERAGRDVLSSTENETLKCGRALALDGAFRIVLAFCIDFY